MTIVGDDYALTNCEQTLPLSISNMGEYRWLQLHLLRPEHLLHHR